MPLRGVVFVKRPLFLCVFCVFVSSQKSPLNHHLVSRYIESSWASSPAEEEEEVDARRRRWKKKKEDEGTWSTSALVYSSTGTSDRRAVSRSTRTIVVLKRDKRASMRMGKGGTRKLGTSCCINNTNRDARTTRRTIVITTRTTRISSLLARRRSAVVAR